MARADQKPPLCGVRFMVGHDAEGRWVVCDETGLVGGLFTAREAAVRFAMFESDYVPGAMFCAPDDTTLSLGLASEPDPFPVKRAAASK